MNKALIITVPFKGSPAVPDLAFPTHVDNTLKWQIEMAGECYHVRILGETLSMRKIGVDGAKTAYASAGTKNIMAALSHLGDDAKLLKDYYADPTLNAKAVGWGVVENSTTDGFLAPHTLSGMDAYHSGLDYPPPPA